MLPFVKMEGAGNDYVYVDGFRDPLCEDRAAVLAPILSDRHFGIGADGLILLTSSDQAACRMRMWNADGSRGAMCGNGLRCLAKLAYDHGHVAGPTVAVECDAGVLSVELLRDARGVVNAARIDMGEVTVDAEPRQAILGGEECFYHVGDAGNPHAVVFLEHSPEAAAVETIGAAFQQHADFPAGVNVEFVQARRDGSLVQRTFERGSGETLACGSGATVAALAAIVTGRVSGPRVPVQLRGGTLIVTQQQRRLALEGPARTVFRGEVEVPDREAAEPNDQ